MFCGLLTVRMFSIVCADTRVLTTFTMANGNCKLLDELKGLTPLFLYGTLKTGQPNENRMHDTSQGHAEYLCNAVTVDAYPLVIGTKYNIPFMLQVKGTGKVKII